MRLQRGKHMRTYMEVVYVIWEESVISVFFKVTELFYLYSIFARK